MASPRACSPASRGGSPEPLTPRSKIRALLATVESSDDEESQTGSKKTKSSLLSQLPRKTHSSPRLAQDGESDESDVAIRPRGKLASRMQRGAANTKGAPRNPSVPETARERVKRILQRDDAEQQENSANGDHDDDGEFPTAPRRLKRRAPVDDESDVADRAPRSNSPGLFVSSPTRPSPAKSAAARDDSDNDLPPLKSDRFKALVERKRQERLAREAAEEALRAERRAQQEHLASELEQLVSDEDVDGITDDEGGRLLTQEVRPKRKASRKAIEEMNRETQRMARSMQLAHEAKTKKKISKASLFERFNYKPVGGVETTLPAANSSSRPTTPQSDVDMRDAADTPPSSPFLHNQDDQLFYENAAVPKQGIQVAAEPGATKEVGLTTATVEAGQEAKPKRRVRVRLPVVPTNATLIDADDDLQITTSAKDKIDALFANIPSKKSGEAQSLQIFRALAQVKSPGKESRGMKDQSKMTPGELQTYLQLKARQQAKLERDRRLEILKGQGIVIQTAEERERQEQEVEDIVAKARQEAQKIMEEERSEAKRQQKKKGQVDPLAWDDSDEEYQDVAEEADAEIRAVETSGSEDEAEASSADEDEGAENALFDEEADSCASEAEIAAQDEDDADEMEQPAPRQQRARNKAIVLSDDEGEVGATPKAAKITTTTQMTPAGAGTISPVAPGSVLRSAKKTFIPGLPVQGPAGLGLTQIFAGTMDSQVSDSAAGPTQSMMPDFDHFPDSNFSATVDDEPVGDMILDSQQEETQGVRLNLSQSQMHGLGTLIADGMQTQMSEFLEPSQDAGLQQHTPLRDRFIEPPFSTVETMVVEKQDEAMVQESPMVRRGRLRRRIDMSIAETAIPEASEPSTCSPQGNAFQAMQNAAKKGKRLGLAEEFNRKKSKAKEMVEEQAEESEDEYAGLGGMDGEDSDNESNGSVDEMIDDAPGIENDERRLAAFYADRERANDEQQVEKLFKDITTGMLRRKRGGNLDLSDSDSDGEARKRMKRRQFAKMQKALFADERVKKIAENPGNQAFLRTIEDRDSDDEVGCLDVLDTPPQADSESQNDTQEQAQHPYPPHPPHPSHPHTIPNSQPTHPPPLPSTADNTRAPASMRRTKNGKKPSNLGEVRETLSNLLDEPHGSIIPATEVGSDSDSEGQERDSSSSRSDKENQPVVDRMSLKRNASCTSSTVRMAFTTQTLSSFKMPALLRRATTNSTLMSGGSSGSSAASSAGGFGDDAKIKKGAGKRSGIGGFARDNEQRAKVQESERRRHERRVKGAKGRIGMVGGILGKGTFE